MLGSFSANPHVALRISKGASSTIRCGTILFEKFRSWWTGQSFFLYLPPIANSLFIQNVNKLNTKASARCSLQAPWIPEWAKPGLRDSVNYKVDLTRTNNADN
jgi:hypothetical protein